MTTIEIIGISKVKVLQTKNNLYFVVKYTIPQIACNLLAVPHEGRVLYFGNTIVISWQSTETKPMLLNAKKQHSLDIDIYTTANHSTKSSMALLLSIILRQRYRAKVET